MNKLPSLDEYNGVVQCPKIAFTDPLLQAGKVSCNNLGLPDPTSGGFALTYELKNGAQRFAVRVFHKHSPDLQKRYAAISQTLAGLKSPYFVDFQFQNQGIRVNGVLYPLVRMDWIDGETLGNFLESHFRNRSAVERLRVEIAAAGNLLEQHRIAHGDLQTGNLLVANDRVRLIDYDGMFVQQLAGMDASELGHRHFQHPGRSSRHFSPQLDRFSMIVLDLSLEAIALAPGLFEKFGTTGENILFTATDYLAPESSDLFHELFRNTALRSKAERLASLCKTDFDKVPSLADFASGRWAPTVTTSPTISNYEAAPAVVEVVRDILYQGNVLDATDFNKALRMEGDRVELIGKVIEVKALDSRYRLGRKQKYLVFLNFGDWRGKQMKASIRGLGTQRLRDTIDKSWTGQWVSVTGMVEPVYRRAGYEHVAITVSESSQLHRISPDEAAFRLGRPKRIRVKVPYSTPQKPPSQNVRRSTNERLLDDIAQVTPGYPKMSVPPANLGVPAAFPSIRKPPISSQIGSSKLPAPIQATQPPKSQNSSIGPFTPQSPSRPSGQPIPTPPASCPPGPLATNVLHSNNEQIWEDIAQANANYQKPSVSPANLAVPATPQKSRNQQLLSQIGTSNLPTQSPSNPPAQPIPTSSGSNQSNTNNTKDMGYGFQIIIFLVIIILFILSRR